MAWNSGSDTGSVSRLGSVNNTINATAGKSSRELFLKQFAGEVLTTFEERNIAMPLHRVRTISNGKSAQFPSIGTASAAYHKAGDTIYGGDVDASEITVTVDDLLVSSTFVPKIDEAMNHYDVRSIYSSEMGNALANAADRNIFSTIYDAATGSGTADQKAQWVAADGVWAPTGTDSAEEAGKLQLTTGGQGVVDGIIKSLELFDTQDVTGEKYCVLDPATYYALLGTDTTAMNRDVGGNGSVSGGNVPTVGGVKILMSNHLPKNVSADATPTRITQANGGSGLGDYSSGETGLKGLVFTKDAAATVKLLDLGVESEYQIERQGTLMVAKYAMGHNVLRNKAAIALV
tara:strand:+ start:55 stop:1095 length:1041 start_codon:yes stop_codon:yes gene_type:complete